MKMRMLFPLLAAFAATPGGLHLFDVGPTDQTGFRPEPKPRNKYNLTDEELELMASMSPKEKKLFLKGRT